MAIGVLVLGESGTGKSTSIRNLEPKDTLLIRVVSKPLPFKSKGWKKVDKDNPDGNMFITDNVDMISSIIKKAKSKGFNRVVIDDTQYIFSGEFFRRSDEKGFQKFTDLGNNYYKLLMSINEDTDEDLRVYFLAHTEETASGKTKMKTIGKMVDEKLTIEGLFTVVLRTQVVDNQYYFRTQNNGDDTSKSPMGMFETEEPNDLAVIDEKIKDYYEIEEGDKK